MYGLVHKQNVAEKLFNLQRLSDYTDATYYLYYLFKEEIPHTTHYTSLLDLVSKSDGSKNLQNFKDICQVMPHTDHMQQPRNFCWQSQSGCEMILLHV